MLISNKFNLTELYGSECGYIGHCVQVVFGRDMTFYNALHFCRNIVIVCHRMSTFQSIFPLILLLYVKIFGTIARKLTSSFEWILNHCISLPSRWHSRSIQKFSWSTSTIKIRSAFKVMLTSFALSLFCWSPLFDQRVLVHELIIESLWKSKHWRRPWGILLNANLTDESWLRQLTISFLIFQCEIFKLLY